jgi:aryl-alcohol dehydrogenase-like predicted oxidoreductase
MTFGREADEATSRAIVDRFLDAGGNFVDTANVYSAGVSEEITGRALGARRADVVLATKVRFPMGDGPNDVGLSRRSIRMQVEASLRRLGTEWIDLYQVHCWDPRTPLEETLSTLDDLVHEGKVRYIGASNFAGWHLAKALGLSALHGWEPFVSLQPEYSLVTRDIERELLPLCQEEGLAVIPWSPLGGGILTGKYTKDADMPAGTRGAETENPITFTYRIDDRTWTILDAVKEVAAATGKTAAQVALSWVAHRRGVTAPIIGARNLEQLEDNLGAVGWTLDEDQRKKLTWASGFRLGYPYEFIQFSEH